AGPLPEKLEKPEKIEANEIIDTGEIPEDFAEDATIAVRPAPEAGPRKRRERHGGKKPNRGKKANHGRNGAAQRHGGNGVNGSAAGPPLRHPDGSGPTLGS
ncbi:MAG: hypothetical protein V3S64_12480, partial [bacterium]